MKMPDQFVRKRFKAQPSSEPSSPETTTPKTPTTELNCELLLDGRGLWTPSPYRPVVRSIDWQGEHYIPVPDKLANGCESCAFNSIKCNAIPCPNVVWMTPLNAVKHRLTK